MFTAFLIESIPVNQRTHASVRGGSFIFYAFNFSKVR